MMKSRKAKGLGQGFQIAFDYRSNPHQNSFRYSAQANSFSQILTVRTCR